MVNQVWIVGEPSQTLPIPIIRPFACVDLTTCVPCGWERCALSAHHVQKALVDARVSPLLVGRNVTDHCTIHFPLKIPRRVRQDFDPATVAEQLQGLIGGTINGTGSLVMRAEKIGSDTMLVAPVTIGDGAYTAAGSVITSNVPAGSLAVARATGADCVALDNSVTPEWGAANVQKDGCVQGNLAPEHMVTGGAALDEAIIDKGKPSTTNARRMRV